MRYLISMNLILKFKKGEGLPPLYSTTIQQSQSQLKFSNHVYYRSNSTRKTNQ
jgi:hypothetical protein